MLLASVGLTVRSATLGRFRIEGHGKSFLLYHEGVLKLGKQLEDSLIGEMVK